jgi:putative endonuclease
MRQYWVYMVRCSDGSYYTGVTNDPDRRVGEHNEGLDTQAYTFKRRPVRLVYIADIPEIMQAIHWEKVVKRWRREKKETLVNETREQLPILARAKNISLNLAPRPIRYVRYYYR